MAAQETVSHAAAVVNRRLVNFLLFAAVAVIAAVLLIGKGQPRIPATLTRMDPATVQRITVQRQRQPALQFIREDNSWRMTAPVPARASTARINAILHLLQTPGRDRIAAAGTNLHTLNLDPAPVTVRMNDAVFRLGGTDPVAKLRYVLYEATVYLVDDSLFYQLTQPAAFFISTRLLPGAASVSRIAYPGHVLYLDGDAWHSLPALAGQAAAATAAAWQRAEAVQVLTYRQGPAVGQIVIRAGATDVAFAIEPAGDSLLLARRDLGVAYQLSKDTAASLGLGKYIHK